MPDLRTDAPLLGFWSVTAHPRILEAAAGLAPAFVAIDTQHGPHLASLGIEPFGVLAQHEVSSIVRVESHDPAVIGRALDLGADGIMAPQVDDASQAAAIVAATRYAAAGNRSYGIQTPRIDPVASTYRPLCAVQIETAAGLDNVDEIAAVDGVDWLYVGPADLGLSIGGIPVSDVISVFEGTHPISAPMTAAFQAVVDAAAKHGKQAGLHGNSGAAARRLLEFGFTISAVATDLAAASQGMAEQLRLAGS